MSEEPRIRPEMTVREINTHYPACRGVFAQYGMGGCGGDLGPDEPLALFAAAHRVDLRRLMAELERATGEQLSETVTPALAFEKRLARLYKTFIRAAIAITLSFGTTWGAYILVKIALHQSFDAPNYAATQAHGHAQLFGWVGLFIMGVAYFSLPKILQARMQTLAPGWMVFGLMLAGILLRAVSQPFAAEATVGWLVLLSAILELLAVTIFVSDLGLVFVRSKVPRQTYDWFIQASLASLLGLAAWNLVLGIHLWRNHASVVPDSTNSKFLYLAVFGFIVNMILGYSLRLLPIFLGLRPTRWRLLLPAFVLFNGGVLARLFDIRLASGLLNFAGMAVYVFALRIFESSVGEAKSRGVDVSFPWFIRLAYAWFAVATTMVLGGDLYATVTQATVPHIYVGSWRHALTVGFITMMMVGLGYRLLPLFAGVDLWRPGWMRITFWLLALGNSLRVTFELATASGERWTYLVMGSSGVMELGALSLFGISMWQTLGRRQQVLYTVEQITPKTHLRWVLDNFPQGREELIHAGLRHLQSQQFIPYFVTLEQAAKVHGIDVNNIVEHLRTVLRPESLDANSRPRAASCTPTHSGK